MIASGQKAAIIGVVEQAAIEQAPDRTGFQSMPAFLYSIFGH